MALDSVVLVTSEKLAPHSTESPPRASEPFFAAVRVGKEPADTMIQMLTDGKCKIGRGATAEDLRGLYTPGERLLGDVPVLTLADVLPLDDHGLSGRVVVPVDEPLIKDASQPAACAHIPADLLQVLNGTPRSPWRLHWAPRRHKEPPGFIFLCRALLFVLLSAI